MVPTEVYLDEVAADSVRAVRSLAEQKSVHLSFDGKEDLPFRGDEALLRRLFVNLLGNAIKYTPSGGDVTLSAERRNGDYLVRVTDTGPGIPSEPSRTSSTGSIAPTGTDEHRRLAARGSDSRLRRG